MFFSVFLASPPSAFVNHSAERENLLRINGILFCLSQLTDFRKHTLCTISLWVVFTSLMTTSVKNAFLFWTGRQHKKHTILHSWLKVLKVWNFESTMRVQIPQKFHATSDWCSNSRAQSQLKPWNFSLL